MNGVSVGLLSDTLGGDLLPKNDGFKGIKTDSVIDALIVK